MKSGRKANNQRNGMEKERWERRKIGMKNSLVIMKQFNTLNLVLPKLELLQNTTKTHYFNFRWDLVSALDNFL